MDYFLCLISRDPRLTSRVPPEFRSRDFYLKAVVQTPRALPDVPQEYINEDFYIDAAVQNCAILHYICYRCKTPKLVRAAIEADPYALGYLPHELIPEDLCKNSVRKVPYLLCDVPKQTLDLCFIAVSNDQDAARFINDSHQREIFSRLAEKLTVNRERKSLLFARYHDDV